MSWPRSACRRCVPLVALLFMCVGVRAQRPSPPADPIDVWSEPNPGLRLLHRTTDLPCSIHALLVDLSARGVRVETTPYARRWRTVSDFARDGGYAAAVNGGFWGAFARAEGVTAGGGERWPVGEDDEVHAFFAVTRAGRAWISLPEEVWDEIPPARLAQAVSGRPMLVRDGEADLEALDAFEHARQRQPRTAVGVSRGGRRVVLLVADGRRPRSRGMTLYEVADVMVELGVERAINLDGGGSSELFVDALGGVINAPSGGRWEARLGLGAGDASEPPGARRRRAADGLEERYVRGVEREVIDHIGVLAPAPASQPIAGGEVLGGVPMPQRGAVVAPRPPALRLGALRETLYPLAWVLALALPPLAMGCWARRWMRRRRLSSEH